MKVSASSAPKPVDGGEIDAVEWMTTSDARARLTHSKDRNLIAAVFNLPRKYNPHPAEDRHRHRDAPMANDEHVALLKQGAAAWNAWRRDNPNIRPDFSGADLRQVDLTYVGVSGADLRGANFSGADLRGALLTGANFGGADLGRVNLSGAEACVANFSYANLREAIVVGTALTLAYFVGTDLENADLSGCHVYGVSAWGVKLDGAKQQNLTFTDAGEPTITVDNIEVAQF